MRAKLVNESKRDTCLTLDYLECDATSTAMLLGQLFVGRAVSIRYVIAAIGLLFALLLASCSDRSVEAQEKAGAAEQLLAEGNVSAANIVIEQAIRLRGDDPNFHLLSARIKIALNEYGQAYEAYQTVLALDPNNFEALVAVAVIGRSLGDVARSREAADRALAVDPTQIDVLMSNGMIELAEKNYSRAMELAERIIEAHPSNPNGYVLRARTLSLQGKNEEALEVLRATVEKLGNSAMLSGALLEAARAQGNVSTMREQYALIATEFPDSPSLALDEINLLYKIGETDAARTAGAEMLRRFADNAGAMRRLHELWSEYDSDPVAQVDLDAVREGGLEARLMVARFLLEQGRVEEAGALVDGAADLRLRGLGARIAVRQGNAGAANGARAILKQDETNCEALGAVAEWELAQGKLQEAVRTAQILATECRDRIDGYTLQARAYKAAGREAAVERVFRDGIEAHPANPDLTRQFTDWLLTEKREAAAVTIASKLTKIAPNRNSSWLILGEVCRRAERSSCRKRAAEGLADAKRNYQLETLADPVDRNIRIGRQWS